MCVQGRMTKAMKRARCGHLECFTLRAAGQRSRGGEKHTGNLICEQKKGDWARMCLWTGMTEFECLDSSDTQELASPGLGLQVSHTDRHTHES